MDLRRLAPAVVLATLVVTTGCEELLGNEEELLGLVCEDGRDAALVGDWWATSVDWGEGNMIAQGWQTNIQLYDDGDGKLVETKPEETSTGTTTVTDSAHLRWAGCDGQLAVVIEQEFIESSSGEYNDVLFDYTITANGLELSGGGMTMTLSGGGTVATSLDPGLFGAWNATHIIYRDRNPDNSAQVDMVADHGHEMVVHFTPNGDYEEVYTVPGSGSETYTGRWTAEEGMLTLEGSDVAGVALRYEYTDTGVTVYDEDGSHQYDFDGDGTDEEATIEYRFVPHS